MIEAITRSNYKFTFTNTFHGYEVVEQIGKGSSSVSYKVIKIDTYEIFCAKIIPNDYIEKNHLSSQIKTEISIMKRINHPNIVKFYESFEIRNEKEDAVTVIIMEYCSNGDMCNVIKTIDQNQREKIIHGFLKSIQYLHDLGIAHLDIKLDNILVDSEFNAKLCDFGFSQMQPIGDDDNKMGTLMYAPPELLCEGDFLTLKADIWEVGITLYCLYENSFPYIVGNDDSIKKQILSNKLMLKNSLNDDIRKIILKCTDMIPENRPKIDEIINDEFFSWNKMKNIDAKIKNDDDKFNLLKLNVRKKVLNSKKFNYISNTQ